MAEPDASNLYGKILLCVIASAFLFLLNGTTSVSSSTAKPQVNESRPQRRNLRLKKESDHPVKIKRINNIDGENWLQDFELELENVSDKPIYCLRVHISFPDVPGPIPNTRYAFGLYYGRPALVNLDRRPDADDVPIRPGEQFTLKIPDNVRRNFERYMSEQNIPQSAMDRVEVRFEQVNFGDGTGFNLGRPYPRKEVPDSISRSSTEKVSNSGTRFFCQPASPCRVEV